MYWTQFLLIFNGQQLLAWRSIHWTFSPTVEKLDSIAGTQPGKRNLVVLEMDTSECFLLKIYGWTFLLNSFILYAFCFNCVEHNCSDIYHACHHYLLKLNITFVIWMAVWRYSKFFADSNDYSLLNSHIVQIILTYVALDFICLPQ